MEILQKIAGVIREEDNFLITSHVRPDGDCIGSQIAMGLILEKLGKKFEIINQDIPRKRFDFLSLFDKIRSSWSEDEKYNVSIVLDCGKWSRIENVAFIARKSPVVINIDHHRDSSGIGTFNYINPGASSTGEIIFSLLSCLNIEIDEKIAESIYTAIVTDTGRFRYSNTTPETHRIAAELLKSGISPEIISTRIMAQETPGSLRFYSEINNTLQVNLSNKIASYTITAELERNFSLNSMELESDRLFDELRTLKGFEIFILFTEMPQGQIRASFRSNNGIDVSSVARFFGGGGHPQACSCIVKDTLDEVRCKVMEKLESLYKNRDQ
jgi:phosphoesterase RecJ-like protein